MSGGSDAIKTEPQDWSEPEDWADCMEEDWSEPEDWDHSEAIKAEPQYWSEPGEMEYTCDDWDAQYWYGGCDEWEAIKTEPDTLSMPEDWDESRQNE